MLACDHTSTAGTAQRVCNEGICKTHAVTGNTVEVRSFHITGIVAAHHLCRMVVRHNINNVQGLLLFFLFACGT
ncbi:unknown [Bacteroides fragilis CAG:558]|nr:unknown [Bacteroides fragilis CAG:558]